MKSIATVQTRRSRASLRFRCRAGRSGAAFMNDELANSLDRLAWLNAELANSMGRSSAASDSQVKAWVCLKAGRLELMAQIVSNTRLPAHPGISGRGAHRRANRHRRELQPTGGAAGIETPIGGARIIHLDEKPLSGSSDRRACSNGRPYRRTVTFAATQPASSRRTMPMITPRAMVTTLT